MMTPKEKAIELIWLYWSTVPLSDEYDYEEHHTILKKCALISIEQCIRLSSDYHEGEPEGYLLEVKKELEDMNYKKLLQESMYLGNNTIASPSKQS